jgi:hypothetical protein
MDHLYSLGIPKCCTGMQFLCPHLPFLVSDFYFYGLGPSVLKSFFGFFFKVCSSFRTS